MTDDEWRENIRRRLDSLERQGETVTNRLATAELNAAVGKSELQNVTSRLGSIETSLNRLVWLLIGAIVSAGAAFVVGGGLNGVAL